MPTKALNRILQGLLLGGLCHVVPVWASAPEQSAAVGQVNLVLGKATLVHANGARETVKTGLAVNVGDRVETQGNAHVHIRFVDNELVSVRPLSRLEIQRYEYRADDPAASVVKFNLIEGVTRAVSGDAAKAARQNFRLNTPVAAIGVRGTDFVVSADPREVRALVNEGAIVMAPFSSTCLVEAIGPCTDNSLELAGGSQQIALVAADAEQPILVSVTGGTTTENFLAGAAVRAENGGKNGTAATPESNHDGGNDPYTESRSSQAVKEKLASSHLPDPVGPNKPDPTDPVGPPPDVDPVAPITPDAPLPAVDLLARQLVWGRWNDTTASRDLITLSGAELAATPNRAFTVSSGAYSYVLFRTENGPSKLLQADLGKLDFNLEHAQAFYSSGGTVSPVDVIDGRLSINFTDSTFATSLDMRQDLIGDVTFRAQGGVDTYGYFNDGGVSMAGAVSQDGKEAGYFFEQALQNGLLEGITLWGSTR